MTYLLVVAMGGVLALLVLIVVHLAQINRNLVKIEGINARRHQELLNRLKKIGSV